MNYLKKIKFQSWDVLVVVLLAFGFLLLFSWHVRVGLIRYFDVDEFTYMHWVALLTQGKKPYLDFFMVFPPMFLFFFAPVFWIAGKTAAVFIAGRIAALGIAAAMFLAVGVLFGRMRSWRYFLLPALLAAFLPMPFDKFFEIRPDNLCTLLAVIGMLFQVLYLQEVKQKQTVFLAGVFYALSLLVFPKAISFIVVAGIVWLFTALPVFLKSKNFRDPIFYMIWGGLVVGGVVFLYLLSLGNFTTVWYSLTKLPLEANSVAPYVMEAHLFFFPNAAWYGGEGFTQGFLLNHALWVLGILVGIYRLFTPIGPANGKKGRMMAELLVAGSFLFNAFLYVSYYPNKHPQYLIPIALFVAFFAADGLVMVLRKFDRAASMISLIFLGVLIIVLYQASSVINTPKLSWVNTEQLNQLNQMQQLIPNSWKVFDLEGRMVFWPQPHYICCLAIGDFIGLLSKPPEQVHSMLEEQKVPYIFQGDSKRLFTLPWDDRVYIQQHYAPVQGWGDTLWRRL